MSTVTFQKATIDDVDAFFNLEKKVLHLQVYSGSEDRDEAREEIENNETYLIRQGDVVVGSTEYQIQGADTAYLSGLVIDPDFQGQGIARKAIEFRFDRLKDMKRIYLVTHPHNSKIICMYLSYGFIVESWKDDYFGDGEPRIVLALNR